MVIASGAKHSWTRRLLRRPSQAGYSQSLRMGLFAQWFRETWGILAMEVVRAPVPGARARAIVDRSPVWGVVSEGPPETRRACSGAGPVWPPAGPD